jgi:predicted acylesterase/phospholipase RssA
MAISDGSKIKIAIACQGGGSQTAFTAGALKAIVDRHIGREFEIVSISGTSGGAVCATLLWFSYWNHDQTLWGRLIDFWKGGRWFLLFETNFTSLPVETFAAPIISTGRSGRGPRAAIRSKSICFRSAAGKSVNVWRQVGRVGAATR